MSTDELSVLDTRPDGLQPHHNGNVGAVHEYLDATAALMDATEAALAVLRPLLRVAEAVDLNWRDVTPAEAASFDEGAATAFLSWHIANQRVMDAWEDIPASIREGLNPPH